MIYIIFFIYAYICGAIDIVFAHSVGSRFMAMFEWFFDLSIITFIICLFPKRISKYVASIVLLILNTVHTLNLFCNIKLNSPIKASIIQIVRQTTKNETQEAINSYFEWNVMISPIGIIILLTILFFITCHNLDKLKIKINISPKTKKIICIAYMTIIVVCGVMSAENKSYLYHRIVLGLDELETQKIRDFNPKTSFFISYYKLLNAITENNKQKDAIIKLEKIAQEVKVDTCSFKSPNIILIIGESYNRHHSQLYGYEKETNPYIQKRYDNGEIIKMTNVISSWNLTSRSFQNMFSLADVYSGEKWYDYPLFCELFKKAGYEVTFISNQFVENMKTTFSEFCEDVFLNTPILSKMQFTNRNIQVHKYDDELLCDYDLIGCNLNKHNLIIFHYMNMHAAFEQRYPSKWNKYKSSDYSERNDLTELEKTTIANYDNAIRYCDYVTDKIISRFESSNSIILFLSDHGERVYDYDNQFGRSLSFTYNEVIPQFDIPMWFWASKEYKSSHIETWERINSIKDIPYMTDRISHLLLGLAGIKCKDYKEKYDLLHPNYIRHLKRIISDEKDYDIIKNNR